MSADAGTFADWLSEVRKALDSINMPMDTWHAVWPFDFAREFGNGTAPGLAALKANRFWWSKQSQRVDQDWVLRWIGDGRVTVGDTANPGVATGRRHDLNPPTTTPKPEELSRALLHNAVAISALVHRSTDYAAFCRSVPGLPGIWSLCVDAAQEFTKQELRIRSQEETDDTYSFEWLDAIERYADAILKLQKGELDRSNLERIAHRVVWGDYGNECPLKCPACQPTV
jgi:hypothetical protein